MKYKYAYSDTEIQSFPESFKHVFRNNYKVKLMRTFRPISIYEPAFNGQLTF